MNKYKIETKFNDILTENIIETWRGENVILNGATGSGKTYFVENNLHTYASANMQKILFLCNRTALYREILDEKDQLGLYNIDVMLYQTLQSKLRKNEEINSYDYIVCDEFHYVLSDAMFNIYTDLTYDWILSQTNSTKIFMSGTAEIIFNKLIKEKVVKEKYIYKIPYDYSYVTELKLFKERNKVFDIINDLLINTGEKIIYFANSLELAIKVYEQFKEYSHFRCSENVKGSGAEKANEYNDIKCIKTYNRNLITFENRLLVTTKALDNGINIKDREVKHIICDVFDLESHQQCLGRKRKIDKDDTVKFYIRNYDKKAIGNFKGGLNTMLNPLLLFIENPKEFNSKYDSDRKFHSDFIYHNSDDVRSYNHLAYWKMISESNEISIMEQYGYSQIILERLGDTVRNVVDLEYIRGYQMKSELELFLAEIKEKMIYKNEQKKLINKINHRVNGRQQTSLKALNIGLRLEKINYTIIKDTDNRRKLEDGTVNPNRRKVYWKVIEGRIE